MCGIKCIGSAQAQHIILHQGKQLYETWICKQHPKPPHTRRFSGKDIIKWGNYFHVRFAEQDKFRAEKENKNKEMPAVKQDRMDLE